MIDRQSAKIARDCSRTIGCCVIIGFVLHAVISFVGQLALANHQASKAIEMMNQLGGI